MLILDYYKNKLNFNLDTFLIELKVIIFYIVPYYSYSLFFSLKCYFPNIILLLKNILKQIVKNYLACVKEFNINYISTWIKKFLYIYFYILIKSVLLTSLFIYKLILALCKNKGYDNPFSNNIKIIIKKILFIELYFLIVNALLPLFSDNKNLGYLIPIKQIKIKANIIQLKDIINEQ